MELLASGRYAIVPRASHVVSSSRLPRLPSPLPRLRLPSHLPHHRSAPSLFPETAVTVLAWIKDDVTPVDITVYSRVDGLVRLSDFKVDLGASPSSAC